MGVLETSVKKHISSGWHIFWSVVDVHPEFKLSLRAFWLFILKMVPKDLKNHGQIAAD